MYSARGVLYAPLALVKVRDALSLISGRERNLSTPANKECTHVREGYWERMEGRYVVSEGSEQSMSM